MTSSAAIEVTDLHKTYPNGVVAVAGISFAVQPGEVFGLLGPNGAGKSTTIGMLTTTVRPTSGTARVGGFDVERQPIAARGVSAVVFQESVVDRTLTGRRNLEIHARLWGLPPSEIDDHIDAVATRFDVAGIIDRPAGTYSGGQRRRLEIARSLLSNPSVLFLDEPTVGLDPRIRHELLDVISGLRTESAMTIMLTTHDLDEAERLCDRVAIVHAGRVVALDTPRALLDDLGTELVEIRVDADAGSVLSSLQASATADASAFAVGATLTVPLRGRSPQDVLDVVTELGAPIVATATRPPTLDDVYLRLTGDRLAAEPIAA